MKNYGIAPQQFEELKRLKQFKIITDVESYKKTLEYLDRWYTFDEAMIQTFVSVYELETILNISVEDVLNDLKKLKITKIKDEVETITDTKSYKEALDLYYDKYKDDLFDEEVIQEFINIYHLDTRFNITPDNVWSDLAKIKKQSDIENKLIEEIGEIEDIESYKEALELYYNVFGDDMFAIEKVRRFIETFALDEYELDEIDITPNIVYRDLRAIKRSFETPNGIPYSNFTPLQPNIKPNEAVISPVQAQTKNTTPPTQTQGRQSQTTSTTPPVQPQSILDEQKLVNYIKSKPVKWEFGNPNVLQNEALKKLCSVFLSSESVSNILSPERCANMELIIQQKRARTPRAADYNKVMDVNILYELYKYSYLMTTFQVLENRKNDTLKIDQVKLWDLIQGDCRKRLENLEQEKRNNPTIRNMFQKYERDTSKIKMVVNDYVEPREYDYIYASLMTNALLVIIIDCVLNGEADIGNGYQPILQIIKQYSASDLMAALDASLNSVVNFTLGMYANSGKIPRRNQ